MRRALFTAALLLAGCMTDTGVTIDPAQLRKNTEVALNVIGQQQPVPARAQVLYVFEPAGRISADQARALIEAAREEGYASWQPFRSDNVVMRSPVIPMTADAIWRREVALAQIAANYGFKPAGWRF